MADPITTGMSALNLSWDTPYRLLVSFTSLGCVFVLAGWVDASGPFDVLGQLVSNLGVHSAPDIVRSITEWLTVREAAVVPIAWLFLIAGVAFNRGDGKSRSTIPGPWRGAPTALLALAVIWEISPEAVPRLVVWAVVVAVVLAAVAFLRKSENLKEWLALTLVNLFFSAIFLVVLPLWPLGRTPAKTASS